MVGGGLHVFQLRHGVVVVVLNRLREVVRDVLEPVLVSRTGFDQQHEHDDEDREDDELILARARGGRGNAARLNRTGSNVRHAGTLRARSGAPKGTKVSPGFHCCARPTLHSLEERERVTVPILDQTRAGAERSGGHTVLLLSPPRGLRRAVV